MIFDPAFEQAILSKPFKQVVLRAIHIFEPRELINYMSLAYTDKYGILFTVCSKPFIKHSLLPVNKEIYRLFRIMYCIIKNFDKLVTKYVWCRKHWQVEYSNGGNQNSLGIKLWQINHQSPSLPSFSLYSTWNTFYAIYVP